VISREGGGIVLPPTGLTPGEQGEDRVPRHVASPESAIMRGWVEKRKKV
jgi:hypothetical protein